MNGIWICEALLPYAAAITFSETFQVILHIVKIMWNPCENCVKTASKPYENCIMMWHDNNLKTVLKPCCQAHQRLQKHEGSPEKTHSIISQIRFHKLCSKSFHPAPLLQQWFSPQSLCSPVFSLPWPCSPSHTMLQAPTAWDIPMIILPFRPLNQLILLPTRLFLSLNLLLV